VNWAQVVPPRFGVTMSPSWHFNTGYGVWFTRQRHALVRITVDAGITHWSSPRAVRVGVFRSLYAIPPYATNHWPAGDGVIGWAGIAYLPTGEWGGMNATFFDAALGPGDTCAYYLVVYGPDGTYFEFQYDGSVSLTVIEV
jgi:hypothetical protein